MKIYKKNEKIEIYDRIEKLRAEGVSLEDAFRQEKIGAGTYYSAKRLIEAEPPSGTPNVIIHEAETGTMTKKKQTRKPVSEGQCVVIVTAIANLKSVLEGLQ